MSDAIAEYLNLIDASGAERERVDACLHVARAMVREAPVDVFISYNPGPDRGGGRKNLFVLTAEHLLEFKNFLAETRFDLIRHHHRIGFVEVEMRDCDPADPGIDAQLAIKLTFKGILASASLTAVGANCKHLLALHHRHFMLEG